MRTLALVSTVILALSIGCNAEKSRTTIEDPELRSVSYFKENVPAAEALELRRAYRAPNFIRADDIGAYAFLNFSEVIPTSEVYRDGPVSELEHAIDGSIAQTPTSTTFGDMPLEDLLKHPDARMQGLLVIHDGKIVFEDYPGMKRTDKHMWFSASKTLVGTLVHLLEDEGLIDIEKNVSFYIPEYNSPEWQKVKVKHLLHHVSGLDIIETNENFKNPNHVLARAFATNMATRYEPVEGATFDMLIEVEALKEPGTAFDYSSMNTQTLGVIIERVTGMKFEDVLSERIWSRTGMESDGMYGLTPFGETMTAGLFASRLSDAGRFGMLFTPSWEKISDQKIISDSYFSKVYDTTYSDIYMNGSQGPRMTRSFSEEPSHATYQWDAIFKDGDLFKPGRYGQGLYVSPETNTVVVWFSNVYDNLIDFPGFARQIVQHHYR